MATDRGEMLIALAKESTYEEFQETMLAFWERHPRQYSAVVSAAMAGGETTERPFRDGMVRASDLPPGKPAQPLWFGLYPRTVTLLIGETGAGKSSLLYNVVVHAARNEELWRVRFGLSRPLRVLYLDPENSGNWQENQSGLCGLKLDRINGGRPVDLFFHDGRGINLSNDRHRMGLGDAIREEQIDLCVLDPIANLFATQDENDNAEAARQMKKIIDMSRETGCCMLCVHHTGKDSHGNYGRGASARLAAADVGIIFRSRGNQEESDDDYDGQQRDRDDVCRLQIVKNRLEGRSSLFLQMAGEDRFTRVTFQEWRSAPRPGRESGAAPDVEEEIVLCLSDALWHSRTDIQEAMRKEGIGRVRTDDTLKALFARDRIACKRGAKGALFFILAEHVPAEDRPFLYRLTTGGNSTPKDDSPEPPDDWQERIP